MTLCICIAPGPVGSLGAPYGSNRVLPPRRGDLQNPEVEGKSDVGSEATEGGSRSWWRWSISGMGTWGQFSIIETHCKRFQRWEGRC